MVDEIADISDSLPEQERPTEDRFFADKLQETERTLARAQQLFPEDAEMVETEARLWSTMKDKRRALHALERAWKKMPRGSGTAIRISKIHASANRPEAQKAILDEALARDSEDKQAHYAMAMFLLSQGSEKWDNRTIARHLSASFGVNDGNFEERYMFAQFLFTTGEVDRADELFAEIDRRAPADFRKIAPKRDNVMTAVLRTMSGTIETINPGYFFLRSGGYPKNIFAHRSAFEESEVDEMEYGNQVFFRIRFNRRGPVAVSVHRKQTDWAPTGAELVAVGASTEEEDAAE